LFGKNWIPAFAGMSGSCFDLKPSHSKERHPGARNANW
jgi:hypothetical protein